MSNNLLGVQEGNPDHRYPPSHLNMTASLHTLSNRADAKQSMILKSSAGKPFLQRLKDDSGSWLLKIHVFCSGMPNECFR